MASKSNKPLTKKELEQKLLREAYQKERRRIQQFISRAEKRGYQFSYTLEKTPQKITKRDIAKLKKQTSKELYKKSIAISETGLPITGQQKRAEERKVSAQKALATRRRNLEQAQRQSADWEKAQREKINQDSDRLDTDIAYRKQFEDGEIVFRELQAMMADSTYTKPNSRAVLDEFLRQAESELGHEKLMIRLAAEKSEVIIAARTVLYYEPYKEQHKLALITLSQLILQRALNDNESRHLNTAYELDETW